MKWLCVMFVLLLFALPVFGQESDKEENQRIENELVVAAGQGRADREMRGRLSILLGGSISIGLLVIIYVADSMDNLYFNDLLTNELYVFGGLLLGSSIGWGIFELSGLSPEEERLARWRETPEQKKPAYIDEMERERAGSLGETAENVRTTRIILGVIPLVVGLGDLGLMFMVGMDKFIDGTIPWVLFSLPVVLLAVGTGVLLFTTPEEQAWDDYRMSHPSLEKTSANGFSFSILPVPLGLSARMKIVF